ncbi:MAG: hypothetical protein ACPGRD_08175 [Planktomarina sp.]
MQIRQAVSLPTPSVMKSRPVDHRGFPVPYFVTRKAPDGNWDFTYICPDRFKEVVKFEKCWVSGQPLGRFKAFCLGPMGVATRTSGDPPVTREIGNWAVQICPYMLRARARRSETKAGLNELPHAGGSVTLTRNPGVVAVWVSKNSKFEQGSGFDIGDPVEVTWWCEGRPAVRADIEDSITHGFENAKKTIPKNRPGDVQRLTAMVEASKVHWPAA